MHMNHAIRPVRLIPLALGLLVFALRPAATAADSPAPTDKDFEIPNFQFKSGDTFPSLRINYRTFGKPKADTAGNVTNAVLILHGTTGNGSNFVRPEFAGELFGPGEPLDASTYYIVLPDGIGHGVS